MRDPRISALVLLLHVSCGAMEGASERRSSPGGPAAAEEETSSSGHERMLRLLRRIEARSREENHWLGDAGARRARARLDAFPPSAPALERFRLTMAVAEHELRLGNERQAIERFEEAVRLLPLLRETLPPPHRGRALFRKGVAYLRHAETRNCAHQHSAESCILPLRGNGIHTCEDGSRAAIDAFEEVLDTVPPSSPLAVKTVRLLALASMTLGRYPHGVPPQHRIPPSVFASEESFPRFENVAPKLDIASFNLSGGAVFDDLDGDGHLDLFTTTFDTSGEPHLFVNRGDGSFVERTREANLAGLYGGLNVVHADYDNDGDLDLYVLRGAWLYVAGRHPNSLLRNDGNARFVDVTFEAGLGEAHYPTQTAAWADYDNDGDVDLFVGNEHGDGWNDPGGSTAAFDAPSQLFRNNGDGTFTDVAQSAGVAVRAYVKGVSWGDYDNDRFPDLYVSVLGGPNRLYHNEGDGTFTAVEHSAGVSEPRNSFPVWFWDFDNDGNLDLWVSSYRGSQDGVALVAASYLGLDVPWDMPRLYRGDGTGRFVDVSDRTGLSRLELPMGSNFGDLDNDGYLDFYLGTGYPDYEAVMPNVLYHNHEGRRFVDVTWAAAVGHLQKGHGVAFADYDHDGDQDLFIQMGGAFPGDAFFDALFENPGFDNRWVSLHLVGRHSNRAAIGARIRADILEEGHRRSVYRHVSSGGSFGCNPLRQTLGLGKAAKIERLEIYWPTSDLSQVFEGVAPERFYRVIEGEERLERLEL